MDKLKMHTINKADENYQKLVEMFPNAITETIDENGNVVRAIDKDVLMQEINVKVVDGQDERYQFTWPDKKKTFLLANTPINKTLRPCRKESVDFDNTENIYIEGDNLEVLKLLQETYLGKIKMIYIDPPYNTGNDFVYEDKFFQCKNEYIENSGQLDDIGNKLVKNLDSNGRFHTNWINMIYPRLKLSKNLLTDDGVIFISIDENEVQNMRKICDEIFGEINFISQLGWQKVYSPKNQARYFSNDYEFILCYCKNKEYFKLGTLPRTKAMNARYKNPDNDPRGDWKPGDCVGSGERKNGHYDVISPITGKKFNVPLGKHWVYAPETMKKMLKDNRIYFGKDGNAFPSVKQFLSEVSGRKASSLLLYEDYGHTDMAKKDLIKLFSDIVQVPFDTPKPVKLLKMLTILGSKNDDIILDFFSGSATIAQSIMELNSENKDSERKFILVQIGEKLKDDLSNNKVSLQTIADVGKERIKRAANKIKEENPESRFDGGFRVLKCDSSNMKNIYYNPKEYQQDLFDNLTNNIKEDRTPEDLLFQVMLDLGILLSSKIEENTISGKKVFNVDDSYLVACFDDNITEDVIIEIAKQKPYYFVLRDASLASDSVATNFDQIFATYSPDTVRKVL